MSDDVKHDWDVPPSDLEPVPKIDIRLDDVAGFRDVLQREVEQYLRPKALEVDRQGQHDFGCHATTPAVADMRIAFQDSLAATLVNVRNYVTASEVLIAAIEKVLSEYDSADGLSSATAVTLLNDALRSEFAAREPAT